ncbi:MAG: AAA family ATPase [Chloroflexi bacterium]|nr:AAA family ATPase [Chloroflexota bacterium]
MLIKSLHLKNILSFKDARLDLQPLNVLIGANGSGKSNLIDVIALLQSVPRDLGGFLRQNGPTGDWIWNGAGRSETPLQIAEILAIMNLSAADIAYALDATVARNQLVSVSERIDVVDLGEGEVRYSIPVLQSQNVTAKMWPAQVDGGIAIAARYSDEPVIADSHPLRSVLSEIRDPTRYPVLTDLAFLLHNTKIYRDWTVSRKNVVRFPQPTDGSLDFLEEDFSNLALVVNDLLSRRLEPSLDSYLKRFYETYESLHPRIFGNTIELIVNETGMASTLPASRLSDGTIRFIALLAILCRPEPPPLICIEEPEIAMHPDSLGLIAELLRKASERTQIIVTTHSPEFVSHFSDEPECIVVCDRDAEEGTQFHRVSRQELTEWQDIYQQTGKELVVYGLSEMWMSGSIGGVR